MNLSGQLRDISGVIEVSVNTDSTISLLSQGPFTHHLNSSPSIDHGEGHIEEELGIWKSNAFESASA